MPLATANTGAATVLDALSSGLSGYLQGRQTAMQNQIARNNAARQMMLAQIQQQRADAFEQHVVDQGNNYNNLDSIRQQLADVSNNARGWAEWNRTLPRIQGLPIEQQRAALAPINAQFGLGAQVPGDPVTDANGNAVMNADGSPQTVPAFGASSAVTDKIRAAAGTQAGKLMQLLSTGPSPQQAQSAVDQYNSTFPDYQFTPPMRPTNYGLTGQNLSTVQKSLGDPSLHGMLTLPGNQQVDLDALRKLPTSVIDTTPNALNAATINLKNQLGDKASAYVNDIVPALVAKDASQTNLNNGMATLIPNRGKLLDAQANAANANANYRDVMASVMPDNIRSLINSRNGMLDIKSYEAQNGRPMSISDVLHLEAQLSKPGPATIGVDANGNVTSTPGIAGKDANPALWQQLESIRGALSPGANPGSAAPGRIPGGVPQLPPFTPRTVVPSQGGAKLNLKQFMP